MTIFNSSSIFQPVIKNIKISNSDLKVISGANTLNLLPLCGFKMDFEQYQRVSVQIPKGQTNFMLSFPMLGIKPTFIAILPKYCGTDNKLNYLKWKFESSSDAKWSMTSILMLSGTTNNPIPPIIVDNPNPDCAVTLEILVSAMTNDYLDDTAAFLYLNELTYDDVHTYNETNSEILAFFNSLGELAGTVNVSDIVNVLKVTGQNRIIIDEASDNNIVLDFITEYDTLQALSAISWLLLDPANRALPKAVDNLSPVITYKPIVNINTIDIDLSTYSVSTFTKQNFIDDVILSVIDDTDDNVQVFINNIKFYDGSTQISSIVAAGTYTAEITVFDIAGNTTTEIINIVAQMIILDTTPPVITTTSEVVGNVINTFNLIDYSNNFTYNDAKLLCLLSIIDDFDGTIPLSSVTVQFLDNTLTTISSITTPGNYTIMFFATDSSSNVSSITLTVTIL